MEAVVSDDLLPPWAEFSQGNRNFQFSISYQKIRGEKNLVSSHTKVQGHKMFHYATLLAFNRT
jgi:hypothetical protein